MTRISVVLSLLCVLCSITSSYAFEFENCGSDLASIDSITISSCDTSQKRCTLPRGKEIHVNAKFIPKADLSNVIASGYSVVLDIPVPFPMKEPEVCKDPDSGLTCPLKKDEMAEYKNTFSIPKFIPPISLDVQWEFRTEKDENIICVKFPAKLV